MNKCIFSEDRKYRYVLEHKTSVSNDKRCLFVCLNPSKADENISDNTVTRCINYVTKWGFGIFVMCNAYAFRSTYPKELIDEIDPIGQDNYIHIVSESKRADLVIAGWGNLLKNTKHKEAVQDIIRKVANKDIYCLELTKNNTPKHPLYLKKDLYPKLYLESFNNGYKNCTLVEWDKIEEHHFVCGCGDCSCHGWDGNHYGIKYGCSCHYYNKETNNWELRNE